MATAAALVASSQHSLIHLQLHHSSLSLSDEMATAAALVRLIAARRRFRCCIRLNRAVSNQADNVACAFADTDTDADDDDNDDDDDEDDDDDDDDGGAADDADNAVCLMLLLNSGGSVVLVLSGDKGSGDACVRAAANPLGKRPLKPPPPLPLST
jgi:hypothetical protein